MNKTLLSFLCCLSVAGLCKAEIPGEILAVIRSSDPEILLPFIEEQLRYGGTQKEWDVILDRIKQIKDRLNIDVKIVFRSVVNSPSPVWCLFTPNNLGWGNRRT
ncbi:MAG: hypothetical protein LBD69_03250 [Puniceicoccales bacterium]|jgi:hypothetical protein|nr:hypothetical protein [Puniceicoccales bacterium]